MENTKTKNEDFLIRDDMSEAEISETLDELSGEITKADTARLAAEGRIAAADDDREKARLEAARNGKVFPHELHLKLFDRKEKAENDRDAAERKGETLRALHKQRTMDGAVIRASRRRETVEKKLAGLDKEIAACTKKLRAASAEVTDMKEKHEAAFKGLATGGDTGEYQVIQNAYAAARAKMESIQKMLDGLTAKHAELAGELTRHDSALGLQAVMQKVSGATARLRAAGLVIDFERKYQELHDRLLKGKMADANAEIEVLTIEAEQLAQAAGIDLDLTPAKIIGTEQCDKRFWTRFAAGVGIDLGCWTPGHEALDGFIQRHKIDGRK